MCLVVVLKGCFVFFVSVLNVFFYFFLSYESMRMGKIYFFCLKKFNCVEWVGF